MTINQLRYFQAVCKHMSFTKAAEELHVSQPAISATIKELEREISTKLFDRHNNTLTKTEVGSWLLERCGEVLHEFDSLETQLHSLCTDNNNLRIGVAPMIGNYYFFHILNNYMSGQHSVQTEIIEAGSLKLREEVMAGVLDIGVVILDNLPTDKVNTLKILECELKLCVSKGHRFAGKESITFADLNKERMVLLKEDSYQNTLIKTMFKEAGSELNLFFSGNQLGSVKKMLYQGNCSAFLFDKVVKDDDKLTAVSLKEPIVLSIGLIWMKSKKHNPSINNFISFVRSYDGAK